MALASIDPDPQRQVYGNLVELSIFSDFIFFNLSFAFSFSILYFSFPSWTINSLFAIFRFVSLNYP